MIGPITDTSRQDVVYRGKQRDPSGAGRAIGHQSGQSPASLSVISLRTSDSGHPLGPGELTLPTAQFSVTVRGGCDMGGAQVDLEPPGATSRDEYRSLRIGDGSPDVDSTTRCHFSVPPTRGFSPSCQRLIRTTLSE